MPYRIARSAALVFGLLAGAIVATSPSEVRAEAQLLIEADSGKVLHAEKATYPWYPASITKLMTTYVALRAVKEGRIKLDSLLTVSEVALAQQPSKMGFPVGTRLTLDDALKMLMVKSANDIAVTIAEGVSGSVEAFASEMNKQSARLGMTQSSWVNPNGLPAEMQVTSARDMAILARTMIREFPQYHMYWSIPAIKLGRRVFRNYNKLIDRYPGADGMKTGFICASGYNLVASATRNGKQLIAIVLGASSGRERSETAAMLLERGFNGGGLSWLMPSLGSVDRLQPIAAEPPNLRDEICGRGRKARTDHAAEEDDQPATSSDGDTPAAAYASVLSGPGAIDKASLLSNYAPSMPPVVVHIIPPPGKPQDPDALMAHGAKKKKIAIGKGKNGRKTAVIPVGQKKPPAAVGDKKDAKPKAAAAKPKAAGRSATAKPAVKPAARPAVKKSPSKPKTAASEKTRPAKSAAAGGGATAR